MIKGLFNHWSHHNHKIDDIPVRSQVRVFSKAETLRKYFEGCFDIKDYHEELFKAIEHLIPIIEVFEVAYMCVL